MNDTAGSTGSPQPDGGGRRQQARAARLKAALKANMARRKGQAKARDSSAKTGSGTAPDPDEGGQQQDG